MDLGPMPQRPASGRYVEFVKPALDRLAAVALLLAALPILAAASVAVALESRGGVLFRQMRIGLMGRPFELLKFRTMVAGAAEMGTGVLVLKNDPRVTRVGKLLRATSLDELPQLWNVLRGEMSLVGPRPTLAYQVRQYDAFQRRRLRLRPGLTGLAQVRGRKSLSWEDRIRLDVEYLERVSFRLDLTILLATVKVVLGASDPPARSDYWGERGGEGPPPA